MLDVDGLTELTENSFSQSTLTWQCPGTGSYFIIVCEDMDGGNFDSSVLDQGLPQLDADLNNDLLVDHIDFYLFKSQWQIRYATPAPWQLRI